MDISEPEFICSEIIVKLTSFEVGYQFWSEAQYYTCLLQHYLLSNPNVVPCQFCGRYFVPKTRKETKYCDSIVRNNRTCKQVAPGLKKRERDSAQLVTSEFERIKDMLFHRRDRMGGNKKASVIDLTDDEFVQWLEAATDARNRYLAGERGVSHHLCYYKERTDC